MTDVIRFEELVRVHIRKASKGAEELADVELQNRQGHLNLFPPSTYPLCSDSRNQCSCTISASPQKTEGPQDLLGKSPWEFGHVCQYVYASTCEYIQVCEWEC